MLGADCGAGSVVWARSRVALLIGVLVAVLTAGPGTSADRASALPRPHTGTVSAAGASEDFGPPSYAGDFPDPSVMVANGLYWAYSTGSGVMNLQVISSPDLHTWTPPVDPLPVLPAWASRGLTWAPSVMYVGSEYVMYYTVHDTVLNTECISDATASQPVGPFIDTSAGPIICASEQGGSIDPSLFLDPVSGGLYLVWKSDDNSIGHPSHIWAERLTADGLALEPGTAPTLLLTATAPWQNGIVEGPTMVRSRGVYYLFYGGNNYRTASSGIGYATSTSLLGPYADRSPFAPWFSSNGDATGPQGPDVFVDQSGALRMAFAAWLGPPGYSSGGVRALWVGYLEVARTGTPDLTPNPAPQGYWFAAADGGVFAYNAPFHGSLGDTRLNEPIVGMASTPDGRGYWLVARDGGIFSFGDAGFYGSTGNVQLAQPIVGMAADPQTGGYWFVGADGGVFAYHAPFLGSLGGVRLNQPVVGMTATADGGGYWLVARDGGIFAFGDAAFHGSTGNVRLAQPIVGMDSDPETGGYWFVAADGGVFSFDAPFYGSLGGVRLNQPVVGMAATPDARGYWMVARDGGIFSFGDAGFYGSAGGVRLAQPIVGMAIP